MDRPEKPSDLRDGEPYYIDSDCPECGTELVQDTEAVLEGWYDEWLCPECDDGVHMDWPDAEREKLDERVEEEVSKELDELFGGDDG